MDQKRRFTFRRRCKTLRAQCCITEATVLSHTALRRRRKRSRFGPLPEGPRGPFLGVLLIRTGRQERRHADFFPVRARFGPKSEKLEKVCFGVKKRPPRTAPEPSLRSPESARYRRPAEHSRSDASRGRLKRRKRACLNGRQGRKLRDGNGRARGPQPSYWLGFSDDAYF